MAEQRYRTAVIVFCEAEGADERDAQDVAELTVRRALANQAQAATNGLLPVQLRYELRPGIPVRTVEVRAVKELNVATINGYITTTPSGRAYRQ